MSTIMKSANPVKALRFFLSLIGLTIVLSAAATPSTPPWVKLCQNTGGISVYWPASTGNVSHYALYVDGTFSTATACPDQFRLFDGCQTMSYGGYLLTPRVDHEITIRAVGTDGSASDLSPPLTVNVADYSNNHINAPEVVTAGDTYTVEFCDSYFDTMEVWKYKVDEDGELKLVAFFNVNGNGAVWDGQQGPAGYGWDNNDPYQIGEYWTEGSRLRMKFCDTEPGDYEYDVYWYGVGTPRYAAEYVTAIVTVAPQ